MKSTLLKNKSVLFILGCLLMVILVYSVDLFHLAYQRAAWREFGKLTVPAEHLVYFVNDTPNVIGYTDTATGERVDCAQALAYVQTDSGETYRCCQAQDKISCVTGTFASEIPAADAACTDSLRATFGVPQTLAGAKDFQAYGICSTDSGSQLTVVQLSLDGQVAWKTLTTVGLGSVNSVLRCAIAPLLLALALRAFILLRRKPDPEKQMRRW